MPDEKTSQLTEILTPSVADYLMLVDADAGPLSKMLKGINLISLINQQRSIFTYNGGATAYTVKAKGAVYACKEKYCYWTSELTTNAIGSPVASTWYYLYLDYSAITSGTAITATELIWSSTAPSWSDSLRGWYNGDDRCIFAVRTNGTPNNILEFFHEGDYVLKADITTDYSAADPGTDFSAEVTLVIPSFARRAVCTFVGTYVDGVSTFFWRTEGQTGTTGHSVGAVYVDSQKSYNSTDVICSSNMKIDVKSNGDNADTISVNSEGWYFPIGM
jgi:hypothetical protein